MNSPWDAPKEYTVSIATNNIRKAIAEASNALSDWLEQSYLTIGDEDDESDFNQFALEMMRVLASHPEQLTYEDAGSRETERQEDLKGPEGAE